MCRALKNEVGVVPTSSNLLEQGVESVVTGGRVERFVLMQWFKHIEPPRTFSNHLIEPPQTFSNHIIAEIATKVCRVLVRGGSTVPNLLYLHLYRGSKMCRVLVRGGSCTLNLLDPSRTTS